MRSYHTRRAEGAPFSHSVTSIEWKILDADRLHALEERDGREAASGDLIRQRTVVRLEADRLHAGRLAGELRAKQAEVRRMKKALASIDLCIHMFKADYQPESVAPKVTLDKNPAGLPKG